MLEYNNLTRIQKQYVDILLEEYPYIYEDNILSRQHIMSVSEKRNLGHVFQFIMKSSNSPSRGNYYIPVPDNQYSVDENMGYKSFHSDELSDEEIEQEQIERFHVINEVAKATGLGVNKCLVVSGAAGIGKSTEILHALQGINCDYVFIKGYIKPTGVFRTLYENRYPGSVIVFDDADKCLLEEDSLSLFKQALDSNETRTVSWLSETRFFDEDGGEIPKTFEFEGSVIVITNLDVENLINKNNKLTPHLSAIQSRAMMVDLGITTNREYMIRIEHVVKKERMLDSYDLNDDEQEFILQYVRDNVNRLKHLSLRMVIHLATCYRMNPDNFETLARVTCLKSR